MKKVYQGKKLERNKAEVKQENFNSFMESIDPFFMAFGFLTEDQVRNDFIRWKNRRKK